MENLPTFILALFGTVVSVANVGWTIRRDFYDRGRLRLTCYIGGILHKPRMNRPPVPVLVWEAVNTGTRRVEICEIGGKDRNGRFFVSPRGELPRWVDPGGRTLMYSIDLGVLDKEPESLWVRDSLGNHYCCPTRSLRDLVNGTREISNFIVE